MQYFAISPLGKVLAVANYPDEVAEFIERINPEPGTFTASGQQVRLDGEPTGWCIKKRGAV